jgi:PAS domain S-box-containing protein
MFRAVKMSESPIGVAMKRLSDLATGDLQARLEQCRKKLAESDGLLQELHIREIELELQNRELIEAQRQIKESRDRYAALYDQAPIGYLTVGINGVIQEVNRTAAGILRKERSDVIGRPMVNFIAEVHHQNWLEHIRRCCDTERLIAELEIVSEDDAIPVQLISINLSNSGDADACLTAMIDITERKQTEDKLRAVQGDVEQRIGQRAEGLQQANFSLESEIRRRQQLEGELRRRMQELDEAHRRKDEFLAMLSHELRNPLAPLRTGLELLKLTDNTDKPVARASIHAMMERQFSQLARLVDDLLDLSRINSGKVQLQMGLIDLRTVVDDTVDSARSFIDRHHHALTLVLPEEPLWVNADATRLHQVILNLLHNAAKYTDAGGHIRVIAERDDSEAVIRVRDNGQGISRELLPRIFEAFTQGNRSIDRAEGGLGLGLALVARLVEMHGGRVEAFSPGIGKGSEFLVRLPLTVAPQKLPFYAAGTKERDDKFKKQCCVLLVDDNVDFVETTASLLRRWGHKAGVATDGPSAIDRARSLQPDVVLLDIGLPGMDGYQLIAALRGLKEACNARFIAISGYSGEQYTSKARDAGFSDYLVKPVSPEMLQKMLDNCIADIKAV